MHQWYWSAPFHWESAWEVELIAFAAFVLTGIGREVYSSPDDLGGDFEVLTTSIQRDSGDAERLKGPAHAIKGGLSRRGLSENIPRMKNEKVSSNELSGVNTPNQDCLIEPGDSYQGVKSNYISEPVRVRSLQQVGQVHSPKAFSRQNSGNSGLAKAGNGYANGDLVVVRYYSEGGQSSVQGENGTVTTNVPKEPGLFPIREGIGPWIGKYSAFFQAGLYRIADEKLKAVPGNMTPGVDRETLDGVSNKWIQETISVMKDKSFQFKPAWRKYIPKIPATRGMRPLGIPTPRDKVIQELYRMILEPLYEPVFKDTSHGFRPGRSCHSALRFVRSWSGVTWMIEGDIKGYFDKVDHKLLYEILKERVKDQSLMELYWKMVRAGYINNGRAEPHSITGVPQGGVISPLLSNIYLHKLDVFMEHLKTRHNPKGRLQVKQNPEYAKALRLQREAYKMGNIEEIRKAQFHRAQIQSVQRVGRRIQYVRYADDWIVGVQGSKTFAEEIKSEIKQFLYEELKLELSDEKTKITHLISEKAKFLGVDIGRLSRKIHEDSEKGRKQIHQTN